MRSSLHLYLLNYHTLRRLSSLNLGEEGLGFLVVIHRELDLFKVSFLLLLRGLQIVVLNVIKHCEVLASASLSLASRLGLTSAAARSNLAIVRMPLMAGIKGR